MREQLIALKRAFDRAAEDSQKMGARDADAYFDCSSRLAAVLEATSAEVTPRQRIAALIDEATSVALDIETDRNPAEAATNEILFALGMDLGVAGGLEDPMSIIIGEAQRLVGPFSDDLYQEPTFTQLKRGDTSEEDDDTPEGEYDPRLGSVLTASLLSSMGEQMSANVDHGKMRLLVPGAGVKFMRYHTGKFELNNHFGGSTLQLGCSGADGEHLNIIIQPTDPDRIDEALCLTLEPKAAPVLQQWVSRWVETREKWLSLDRNEEDSALATIDRNER